MVASSVVHHGFVLLLVLVTLVHYGHANDEEPLNYDAFGGNKPCPNFRCANNMTPVPKTRAKFSSSGCGTMGGGIMMMGKDKNSGKEVYAPCCDLWHACYQTCGAPKKSCDDGYDQCTKELCDNDNDCEKTANINSMMIKIGGCQKYDQAQYQACECVPKDKAEDKRADAIRYFYKKHAPSGVEKAKELAKKADSTTKMAGLFKKLLAKYPDAIQKIEDPQQAMYQKMMDEAKEKGGVEEEELVSEEQDDLDVIEEL